MPRPARSDGERQATVDRLDRANGRPLEPHALESLRRSTTTKVVALVACEYMSRAYSLVPLQFPASAACAAGGDAE